MPRRGGPGGGRPQHEQAPPEARGDPDRDLAGARDGACLRLAASGQGADPRPLRELHLPGAGRYGFAAASEHYFGRPLESLGIEDADKAACLAGIAKSPRAYAPTRASLERSRRRRDQVLGLMAARGYVSRELAGRLRATPLTIARPRPLSTEAPAAVEQALRELRRDGRWGVEALAAGRISLHSTLDNRIQAAANDALEEGLRRYEQRHPGSGAFIQGAVVVLRNRDAAVLALVGGRRRYRGLNNSWADLNRAVESRRQPGSTIKPLLYLAAFRNGSLLNGLVPDEPIAVPMGNLRFKWVSNYDGAFQGQIALREALAQSRNAPAVWLAREIGVEPVLRTARDLGLATPMRPRSQHRPRRLGAQPARPREHVPRDRVRPARAAVRPGQDHGPPRRCPLRADAARRAAPGGAGSAPAGPGRAAGHGAAAPGHRPCAGRFGIPGSRAGKNGHDERLPRRALRRVDLRDGRNHRRRVDRVRRQPHPRPGRDGGEERPPGVRRDHEAGLRAAAAGRGAPDARRRSNGASTATSTASRSSGRPPCPRPPSLRPLRSAWPPRGALPATTSRGRGRSVSSATR